MQTTRTSRNPYRIALVGAGHRGFYKGLEFLTEAASFSLVAACDPSTATHAKIQAQRPSVQCFTTLDELLQTCHPADGTTRLDCAYVAAPYPTHFEIVCKLVQRGISVLKEKPAGLDVDEVERIQQLSVQHNVCVLTAANLRFGLRFAQLAEWLPQIGTVKAIEAARKIDASHLGQGWRASNATACGGAVIDCGFHALDNILGLMGPDYEASITDARLFITKETETYDCDDTAHITMDLRHRESMQSVACAVQTSRISTRKVNDLTIQGSHGILTARGSEIELHIFEGAEVTKFKATTPLESDFPRMVEQFRRWLEGGDWHRDATFLNMLQLDKRVTGVIKTIYQLGSPVSRTRSAPPAVKWPRITTRLVDEVVDQLQTDISIYGNDGVFADFESEFKLFHARPDWHALLHNSGTNALQSLYYAADFQPGDEVIFPVYSFHATSTPAMVFGIDLRFCDVDHNGNMCPAALRKIISSRTKAVVITHMWGMPCQMDELLAVLQEFPQVLLLEDCSHAHGASIRGQKVGTFGDGAAWSIQGQKLITGGEGGICLTKHAGFHYRQLVWGHYNRRCKLEIPRDHDLFKYSLTGVGAKNRAHPIAVRIALHMLRGFPEMQKQKNRFAEKLAYAISEINYLDVVPVVECRAQDLRPAWYAFVVRFNAHLAPAGLTRQSFVKHLHDNGLSDADIPGSTGPLDKLPLYTEPSRVLQHVFKSQEVDSSTSAMSEFPGAYDFFTSMFKLSVPAYADEEFLADKYTLAFIRADSAVRLVKNGKLSNGSAATNGVGNGH